jgi:hypothetical protein
MKLPRFHPFLWPKMAILGQKKPRAPVISGAKRLGHASFRNCIADAFGGALHGRDIQLLGDVLFRSLSG